MERSINSPGSDDYDSINRVSKERFELAFDKKPHTNNWCDAVNVMNTVRKRTHDSALYSQLQVIIGRKFIVMILIFHNELKLIIIFENIR